MNLVLGYKECFTLFSKATCKDAAGCPVGKYEQNRVGNQTTIYGQNLQKYSFLAQEV